MRSTLYIRLSGEPGPVQWLLESDDGHRSGFGPLEALPGHTARDRVVVFVPGTEVTLAATRLPTKKRQRMLQALPFALEDQLADDVDTLHFALGSSNADGSTLAAAVGRDRMAAWLEHLHEAGIEADAVIPETAALPWAEAEWTLLLEPERLSLRSGPAEALTLERVTPEQLLGLALRDRDPPDTVRVFDCREERSPIVPPAGVTLEPAPCESTIATLAGSVREKPFLNLMQGPFSRREAVQERLRIWRPAAILAAALLVIQVGIATHRVVTLQAEEQALAGAIETLYRETFPEARRVVDARTQMEHQLNSLRSSGGEQPFAALLARAAPLLTGTAKARIDGLNYRDGQLEVDLTVGDLQGLDKLKQALTADGLAVEIVSATARDQGVESRLTISGGRA